MNPFAIPALMSVFGAVLGFNAGGDLKQTAYKQEQQAEQNALIGRRELAEQVRRQGMEDQRLRSSLLARQAASGAEVGSGSNLVQSEAMEDEQANQLNWLKTSGASKIRMQLQSDKLQASITKDQGKNQQWSSIIQGAMGAFAYADKGGMMDWGGGTTAGATNSPGATSASGFRIGAGGGFQ
jgi:hypothetical protein